MKKATRKKKKKTPQLCGSSGFYNSLAVEDVFFGGGRVGGSIRVKPGALWDLSGFR